MVLLQLFCLSLSPFAAIVGYSIFYCNALRHSCSLFRSQKYQIIFNPDIQTINTQIRKCSLSEKIYILFFCYRLHATSTEFKSKRKTFVYCSFHRFFFYCICFVRKLLYDYSRWWIEMDRMILLRKKKKTWATKF